MNDDKEVKEFQAFIVQEAKSQGKDPKKYAQELGEDGLKKAYQRFQAQKQKKTQKALHGAKLNYFKSLKHQCAEDEELVYYKKGGSVNCGCKKKEEGGEIPKSENGWKTKFKARKASAGMEFAEKKTTKKLSTTNDSTTNKYPDPTEGGKKKYDPNTKKYVPVTDETKKKWKKNLDDARKGKGEGTPQRKCGGKVKKNEDGSKIKKNCSGAIAKFKMHRQGGNLNGIPFYLKSNNN